MKVTMMLADAAQSVGGKLFILGGGWSVISPGPQQMAIAVKFEVPWDRTNQHIEIGLELVDEDGAVVTDPAGTPVRIGGAVEVGRPAGIRPGTPLDVPISINAGVMLEPDRRYVWRLVVDGQTSDHWQCAFTTRREDTT
jgi:hypothetical protein